jgi:hypothetical protein
MNMGAGNTLNSAGARPTRQKRTFMGSDNERVTELVPSSEAKVRGRMTGWQRHRRTREIHR